jgi:hypothetical protein
VVAALQFGAQRIYQMAQYKSLIFKNGLPGGAKTKKRILFFENKARKLLKTQERCGKNSQNKPETNLKQS